MQPGVRETLTEQDGVVGRDQLYELGVSYRQIRTMVGRGDLELVLPGVYRSTSTALSAAGQIRAAVVWAGKDSMLSGVAAAWWWNFVEAEPSNIEVTIPHRRRLQVPESKTIEIIPRRRSIAEEDRRYHRGIVVTSPALSAIEGSLRLGHHDVLDRALQKMVSYQEVVRSSRRMARLQGAPAASRLVKAAGDGAAFAAERLFAKLMRDAGITGWVVNKRVEGAGVPDFRLAHAALIVEIDGWAWHQRPDRFQRDRTKQNELVCRGHRVLRFTWFDLNERPEYVVAQVLSMLN